MSPRGYLKGINLDNNGSVSINNMDDTAAALAFPERYNAVNSYQAIETFQLGPLISKYKLSDEVLKKMVDITENVLKSEKKIRYGHHLAGQIDSEYLIPNKDLEDNNLTEYFENVMKCYLRDYFVKNNYDNIGIRSVQTDIDLGYLWIVEQFKNEYNPVHWHEQCTLSAVMYLKVHEMTNEGNIPGKKNNAGNITFINRSVPNDSFEMPLLSMKPESGDIFIFPGHLMHTVYPFHNDVRRVSVAFNATHSMTGKKFSEETVERINNIEPMELIEQIKNNRVLT